MKRLAGAIVASLALCNSAHATIYSFEYTAVVTSIVENLNSFGGGSDTYVQTTQVPGVTISVGDTVTGRISYDSHMRLWDEYHDIDGNFNSYSYYDSSIELSANFVPASLQVVPYSVLGAGQSSYQTDSTHVSAFGLGGYTYRRAPDGDVAQEMLQVEFVDSAHTKFEDNAIPGANLSTFDNKTLEYYYRGGYVFQSASITGNITSMHLISAVPEPSTYAMLLGGLMLLAWRRRNRA